jgi:hypothetical protein
MRLEELEIRIAGHAYERYCQRVEPVTRQALERSVAEELQRGYYRRHDYIQIAGVWWRYSTADGVMTLHTCYGRHHIDLPAAIKWAKRYKDRIVLGEVYGD